MQDYSEVPTNTEAQPQPPENWAGPPNSHMLLCVACGSRFEASPQQPRVRCPICGTVGYPDRAGRNLVSTAWECLACGTRNPETTNFCLECSAGLASRCLRCEFPVYTSICHRCGSPQDKLLRMYVIEQERAEWMPIQRSVLDAEQRNLDKTLAKQADRERKMNRREADSLPQTALEAEPAPQINSADWQHTWPQVDQQMRQAAQQRSQRLAQKRSNQGWRVWRRMHSKGIMLVWLIIALIIFLWQSPEMLSSWWVAIQQTAAGQAAASSITAWWETMQTLFASPGAIDKSSPEYTAFFAITVFGIAAIPVFGYLLTRIVRWLIH
jgi:hypothetical protein